MRTKAGQYQDIVAKYRAAGQTWPATMALVANWALKNGMWAPHPQAALRQLARELSRAMREEYMTDPMGRRVRTKHAVVTTRDGAQIAIWDDIRTAPRKHMAVAFQQRRERIVGDCRQLKTDVDSYNDAHIEEEPIQLVFDFTRDLRELEGLDRADAA